MKLEYDLVTLNEIHDQIKTSQSDGKDGASMEARRKQRIEKRKASMEGDDMVQFLRDKSFIEEA